MSILDLGRAIDELQANFKVGFSNDLVTIDHNNIRMFVGRNEALNFADGIQRLYRYVLIYEFGEVTGPFYKGHFGWILFWWSPGVKGDEKPEPETGYLIGKPKRVKYRPCQLGAV